MRIISRSDPARELIIPMIAPRSPCLHIETSSFLTQARAFVFEFDLFLFTLAGKAAVIDKFEDLRQFRRVEPNAMLLAPVDDHAGRS